MDDRLAACDNCGEALLSRCDAHLCTVAKPGRKAVFRPACEATQRAEALERRLECLQDENRRLMDRIAALGGGPDNPYTSPHYNP